MQKLLDSNFIIIEGDVELLSLHNGLEEVYQNTMA